MLWLVLIGVGTVLMFVLFAKPTVNTTGLERSWTPPAIVPPNANASQPTAPVALPPADVQSVHFNDVFAPPKPPGDRPNA